MNKKDLTYKPDFVYDKIDDNTKTKMEDFCSKYRAFLNSGKTERECVNESVKIAEENGFVSIEKKDKLVPGDKVYIINREKNIVLAVIGKEPIQNGFNMVGSHIDSPRLDLKQNPLYESCNMSMLDTHYYGGIKKYQWTTIPLSIHGVIFTQNGEKINLSIGEDENDPVFCISDLLPHLAKDQMSKKLSEGIEGEDLNIIFGGYTLGSEKEKSRFKQNVLHILNKKYGIIEKDFLNAEIEVVPAFKAKNVGLDGAFVGSYGQDDRVCAFTSLMAVCEEENPEKTSICIMSDKEEIGSCGNTGFLSDFFKLSIAEIIEKTNGSCDFLTLSRTLSNSSCLSSDVGAAVDPNYENVNEKKNAPYAGNGILIMKYTGARGKSGSNDANSEFVYKISKIFDDNNIIWQTGELGKVDQGGGGTIAQYAANLNMDVIDCGVPVISMHSPFEITAKTDIFMAYLAYKAFYESK